MQGLKIDKLTKEEIFRLKEVLPHFTQPAVVDDVYWIPIPEELLTPIQLKHKECQPHYFAVEVGENFLNFEFLARTFQRVRCACMAPATPEQKLFLMELAKKIFTAAGVEIRRT